MNREIKFRAWDTVLGQMYHDVSSSVVPMSVNDLLGGTSLIPLQFTGLHDKNGKEIYEGDIVRYDFLPEGADQKGVVVFKGRSFCLSDGNNYMPEECEIIGNIYENPELLK